MCGEMTKHCGLFSPLFRLSNALILSDETFFIRIFCPLPVTFGPSRLYWRVKGAGAHDEHTGLEPMSLRDVTRLPVYKFTRLQVYTSSESLVYFSTGLLVYPFTRLLVRSSPFIHPLNFNLMLTYHVIRRKNIKTGDILYYPQLVTAAADDRAKIIERIEKKCTLASADVKAVVDALEVEIIDCLQQGRSIRLGDLGSFRPSLRCGKGVKEEQSVSPAMIKRVHIVFHPSSRIRRALSVKDHAVSFYRRDKKKKGDGTNQPGTTPPGTNPAGTGGVPSGTGGNPSGTPTPGGTPVATGGTAVPAPVGTGGNPSGTGGNPSGTPTPGGTPVATGGTAAPAPGGVPTVAPAGH